MDGWTWEKYACPLYNAILTMALLCGGAGRRSNGSRSTICQATLIA